MPSTPDYSALDHPGILPVLFHPRKEGFRPGAPPSAVDLTIPVAEGIHIGACLHGHAAQAPCILFFHGNGEIVSDYDDFGVLYTRMGLNFLAVDYRGYGRSTGRPSVSAMMRDCHTILDFTLEYRRANGLLGPLLVMGRSLGSAPALELAASRPDRIGGLIIESGFAHAAPLLRLLGIDPDSIGFREEHGFRNVDKIGLWTGPTLIIHGEEDHLIPLCQGEALFEACGAGEKRLLKISGAGHNDLFIRGMSDYLGGIGQLAGSVRDRER